MLMPLFYSIPVIWFWCITIFAFVVKYLVCLLGVREVELKAAGRPTEVLVSVKVLNPMQTVELIHQGNISTQNHQQVECE